MFLIMVVSFLLSSVVRADTDPYLWLEDVTAPKSLEWVKAHNDSTLPKITGDARYKMFADEIRHIVIAPDRLPSPELRAGWIYNLWQDSEHVKGLWRRARIAEFAKSAPAWETVLDLDALAKAEKENWVWKGALCLAPEQTRCLLQLSRAGKDAVVVREFDTTTKAFVADGFVLPEAKIDIAWRDKDTVLVGTDFGPGSLTLSGYSRLLKIWKRGTKLADAKLLVEGKETDVEITPFTMVRPEGTTTIIVRGLSFFTNEVSVLDEKGALITVPLPQEADMKGVFDHQLVALMRSDWGGFKQGSLVALPLDALGKAHPEKQMTAIYTPDDKSAFSSLVTTRHYIYLVTLENVKGRLLRVAHDKRGWQTAKVAFPDNGVVSAAASDDFDDTLVAQYESFLVPTSQYLVNENETKVIRRLPARFDSNDLTVDQFEAVSTDGTHVPYFLVHKKNMKPDGATPTLLYGYGGFEINETPFYLSTFGKVWAERGGAFALANIRGGGEFGPRWHEAALTVHRQRAFDDFASVARDLISRKVTTPRRLGIRGGSNGGLLMGASFTQHPELYNAVVCEVGLLDMLRYHKLLAGYSWVGEYGDPDDPKMAEVIRRYSPYQNVRPEVQYPKVFFLTSTADDRVHPGHSRKMVARMEEQGHPVLYYENTEGGHGGAATLEQSVTKAALEDTYLFQQLFD